MRWSALWYFLVILTHFLTSWFCYVSLLFIIAFIVCEVFGHCFNTVLWAILVLKSSCLGREGWLLYFYGNHAVLWLEMFVFLPLGAGDLSKVCECGISWPHSPDFLQGSYVANFLIQQHKIGMKTTGHCTHLTKVTKLMYVHLRTNEIWHIFSACNL